MLPDLFVVPVGVKLKHVSKLYPAFLKHRLVGQPQVEVTTSLVDRELCKPALIFVIDESVVEDAAALMHP